MTDYTPKQLRNLDVLIAKELGWTAESHEARHGVWWQLIKPDGKFTSKLASRSEADAWKYNTLPYTTDLNVAITLVESHWLLEPTHNLDWQIVVRGKWGKHHDQIIRDTSLVLAICRTRWPHLFKKSE